MTAKTDRELLALAAKAAGYAIHDFYIDVEAWAYQEGSEPDHDGELPIFLWKPLTDDGDALRLAVKVRINIYNPPGRNASASVAHGEDENAVCSYLNEKSDDAAATRRAIVRAAAVIGETL